MTVPISISWRITFGLHMHLRHIFILLFFCFSRGWVIGKSWKMGYHWYNAPPPLPIGSCLAHMLESSTCSWVSISPPVVRSAEFSAMVSMDAGVQYTEIFYQRWNWRTLRIQVKRYVYPSSGEVFVFFCHWFSSRVRVRLSCDYAIYLPVIYISFYIIKIIRCLVSW